MKRIISFTGPMGSGKSTIAKSLYGKLDNCMIIPMAGIAKQCVEIITGVQMNERQPDGSYDFSRKQKEKVLPSGMHLGAFIRDFAEHVRLIDKFIWIDATFNIIESSNHDNYIIPDVRMLSEWKFLNSLNDSDGYTSFIFRILPEPSLLDIIPKLNDGRDTSHNTENELNSAGVDAVYYNSLGEDNIRRISNDMYNFMHRFFP